MAGRSGPVHGVPRIGPVWTPPEQRRRGYAAALTAQICAEALAIPSHACTLYADAANATANGVYTRIGFRPVAEIVETVFEIT
jgi:predicted GNAT family acetyltransferase